MKIKKIIINMYFLITALIIFVICMLTKEYQNKIKKIETMEYSLKKLNLYENLKLNETKQNISNIINEYKGYTVEAKLEIPIIKLDTYVLKNFSEEALNVSVAKFWGAEANAVGNFCVAGHNFKNEKMFRDLKKLKIGDNLFLSDNKNGKIEYEIYDIYEVFPENIKCLSQETKGRREITLITCTNSSKKRIIVKAREKQVL